MKRERFWLLLAILLVSLFLVPENDHFATADSPPFRFAAAGDHNQSYITNSSLERLSDSGVNFYLALGDLSYTTIGEETTWCNIVKSYVGPDFPFELVSGYHDVGSDTPPNGGGLIDSFANCLPDRLGSTGVYGKEYFFDYPRANPLARIIMISPDLNFTNVGYYSYSVGTVHYKWLSDTIDGARASGIPWIIVGMHKPCISAGLYHNCVARRDVMNLLLQKRVDLVLQAHDHDYQRSKQLTCAEVEKFVSSCVSNDGSSGVYPKGRGTVFVIAGTFGQEFYPINFTNPNAQYFASFGSNNTNGMGHGFVQVSVSAKELKAQTDFSDEFSDSFEIVKPDVWQSFTYLLQDNSIFVLLSVVPVLAGITAMSFRRWKKLPVFGKD
jgi:Calcineurin-like phosphoesterase